MHYYAAAESLLCLNAQLSSAESGSGFLSSWMCDGNWPRSNCSTPGVDAFASEQGQTLRLIPRLKGSHRSEELNLDMDLSRGVLAPLDIDGKKN